MLAFAGIERRVPSVRVLDPELLQLACQDCRLGQRARNAEVIAKAALLCSLVHGPFKPPATGRPKTL